MRENSSIEEMSRLRAKHLRKSAEYADRIEEIRIRSCSASAPIFDGMPKARGHGNRIEHTYLSIEECEERRAEHFLEALKLEKEMCIRINAIPDSMTRLLAKLRYIDLMPWAEIVKYIKDGSTIDSAKKYLSRRLKAI